MTEKLLPDQCQKTLYNYVKRKDQDFEWGNETWKPITRQKEPSDQIFRAEKMAKPDLVDLWGFNYEQEEKEACRGDALPSVVNVCLRMLQNAL